MAAAACHAAADAAAAAASCMIYCADAEIWHSLRFINAFSSCISDELPQSDMVQSLSNFSGMQARSLVAFRAFLATARTAISFQRPVPDSEWNAALCSSVMIIALRSQTDVLSGTYDSLPAFERHVTNVAIVDEPVPTSTL